MKTFLPSLVLGFFLALAGCGSGRSATEPAWQAFDGARALAAVQTQVDFGPRVPDTPAHDSCSGYFLRTLKPLAGQLETDRWAHVAVEGDTLALVNITASFNKDSPRRVLFCAHWDSRPVADQDPDQSKRGQPIPGANDGASGAAVLLELARVFQLQAPPVGVDLVFLDGEDYGDFYVDKDVLLGSRRFAKVNHAYRPEFGVLLDMVGDKSARFPWEGNSRASLPDICNLVWDTAHKLGYSAYFPRQEGIAVIDDHIPLLQTGIRCIDLIQMGLPYWHTSGDTPDKLSPATLEAVGRTLAAVVYNLAH